MSVNTPAHGEQGRDQGLEHPQGSDDARGLDGAQALKDERPPAIGRASEDKRKAQNDPKATQRLRLEDVPDLASVSAPHLDPKATQVIRVADASAVQPILHESDVPLARDRAAERFSLRPWMARHKRILILVAVLVGIAVLAISGVAIRNAQGVQGAVVGIGGPQMRAARLAQADLSGQDLKWANLAQADLRQANLSGADLLGADLGGADLSEANLSAAILRGVDLSGAKLVQAVLSRADLHWAVMRNADLSQADLREADLGGADLENAILEGANLEGANMDNVHTAGTILPDGSVWGPSTNLRRFTDPTHPEFWRPGDAQSLAHR